MSIILPELKSLPAISNRRAVTSKGSPSIMTISTKLRLTKNYESITCTCSMTGIVVELLVPSVPDILLDYRNPLAFYSNCVKMLEQPRVYLESLDLQVLAGIWITCYKHYDLIHSGKQNGSILNSILRTAPKSILVDSLELFCHLNSSNSKALPRFSLDYTAHKEFISIAPAVQEYSRIIRTIIYPDVKISTKDELALLLEEKYAGSDNYLPRKKPKISHGERDYEESFIANRREAKAILSRLSTESTVPLTLINKLKPLFVGKNLVVLSSETRAKVVTKLLSFGQSDTDRLAAIVKEGHNPYDIFAKVDEAFADTEAKMNGIDSIGTKKRSLAEILAAKNADSKSQSELINTEIINTEVVTSGSEF